LDKTDRNSEAAHQPHPHVRESDQWRSLVDQIIERHGRLDVLVDVAGVTQRRSGIHDADFTE
jgi:NAD(P)-dependent dehydrogenase (short-subunit alcohol dehydrogenase family)